MSLRCICAIVVLASSILPAAFARKLPSSYSLANHGYMIPIKNQGALGTCWSFSSTTVFETSLVREGLLSVDQASNITSDWDMAVHAGEKVSFTPPYKNWGAFPQNAIGYLTRGFGRWKLADFKNPVGGGPVLTTNSPQNAFPLAAGNNGLDLAPYAPPANQQLLPFRLVQVLEFVDTVDGNGKPPSAGFRDRLKEAILEHGALDTNMNANNLTGATNTMNTKYDTYAYTGNSLGTDHDVTVIGWNDDVPVLDNTGRFLGKGAWLIQNSWGTDEFKAKDAVPKPRGCFWLGYCDTAALKYCCAYVTERRGGVSDTVLQNQIFNYGGANTTSAGSAPGKPTYAAEKLVAQTDTKLLAIGLWTAADDSAFDIDIYSAWGAGGPAGKRLARMHDVVAPNRGYVETPLPDSIFLAAGQPVYVVVNFGSHVGKPIALDTRALKIDGADFHNITWTSSDGVHWQDLVGNGKADGVFIMKGIQGGKRVPRNGATLSVTSLSRPLVTAGTSATLRGVASSNTARVLWRLGSGPMRRAAGSIATWKIIVHGLKAGRNVVSIWPATSTGVATKPVKVTITRS